MWGETESSPYPSVASSMKQSRLKIPKDVEWNVSVASLSSVCSNIFRHFSLYRAKIGKEMESVHILLLID